MREHHIPCNRDCFNCKYPDCVYGGPPFDDVRLLDKTDEIEEMQLQEYSRLIDSGKRKSYIIEVMQISEDTYNRYRWKRANKLRKERRKQNGK